MLYQKNALQHFSFAESPLSKEEKKEELRRLSQRMEALQLSVKQNDLPVIVLVEGWGTSGKGSRIAAMIRQMDPRFFQVALCGKVIDFRRLHVAYNADKGAGVGHISPMEVHQTVLLHVAHPFVQVEVFDACCVKGRGTA